MIYVCTMKHPIWKKLEIIISFPIKKKREKNTKKLHSMYSSATALQFSYQSQQIRKLTVLCKWNLRKTKKREKERKENKMGTYTFHESDVSRWVLHEQCFDPKPTFHTSVHIHIHLSLCSFFSKLHSRIEKGWHWAWKA